MSEEAREIKDATLEVVAEARRLERKKLARRTSREILLLLVTAYFAIWMHTLYLDQCIQQSYLTETRALVCKVSFWPWSGDIEPGIQVSNRAPAAPHDH